jgi:hypothetical protein
VELVGHVFGTANFVSRDVEGENLPRPVVLTSISFSDSSRLSNDTMSNPGRRQSRPPPTAPCGNGIPAREEQSVLLQADDELLAQFPQLAVQRVALGEVNFPALSRQPGLARCVRPDYLGGRGFENRVEIENGGCGALSGLIVCEPASCSINVRFMSRNASTSLARRLWQFPRGLYPSM